MRVTNNMIMTNSRNNINAVKVALDKANTQMTTQQKISRPSEDPVTAIRSLRLSTSLSKINQYYEKNIPDAESWLDVTETALTNMKSIISDFRTLTVQGSNGINTADDRSTILNQLQALQEQLYAEGNADYADRTVFTGYRTDQTLTFTDTTSTTSYNITQDFNAASAMENYRYYNGKIEVPTTEAEVLATDNISDMTQSNYNRIRLGYDNLDDIQSVKIGDVTYTLGGIDTSSTATTPYSYAALTSMGVSYTDATSGTTYAVGAATNPLTDNGDGTYSYTDAAGVTQTVSGANFNASSTAATGTITVYDNEEAWAAANASTTDPDGAKTVGDNDIIIIKSTGEMIFGNEMAKEMKSDNTSISINYDKTGFTAGELKPEYYYNCTDISDRLNADNWTTYTKYDENGKEIKFDINYTIASNQDLTVNLQASDVFDASIYQDIQDMIDAVSNAVDAHNKLDKLQSMQSESQYESTTDQEALTKWVDAAQKEADYYDDNLKQMFSAYIGNADTYLDDITLSITKVGCKADQLSLTKNRMSDQQESVEELQSTNDDVDLSEIVLTYTSAYTAYQSSLTAAGKLGEVSLLNYI